MPNRTEALLPVVLDPSKQTLIKRQLYLGLRDFILAGTLPAGARLPSTRSIAAAHGISRSTVVDVFEQLLADGFATGTIGSGTYINKVEKVPSDRAQYPLKGNSRLSERGRRILHTPVTYATRKRITGAFRNGLPALDLFPRESWARHLASAARHASAAILDYGDAAGFLPLRTAISERSAKITGIFGRRSVTMSASARKWKPAGRTPMTV
ncbi:GntR family transcriptional regulator [Tunturiibacter psychrotolerans]|uniref:GntR family transcriptional regulator n=1 Tax=Tunturiibacter psychrotolerans TaxID=3069686 RepID=UPI003D22D61D